MHNWSYITDPPCWITFLILKVLSYACFALHCARVRVNTFLLKIIEAKIARKGYYWKFLDHLMVKVNPFRAKYLITHLFYKLTDILGSLDCSDICGWYGGWNDLNLFLIVFWLTVIYKYKKNSTKNVLIRVLDLREKYDKSLDFKFYIVKKFKNLIVSENVLSFFEKFLGIEFFF